MITDINSLRDISSESDEGKILIAAIAILTSINKDDIPSKWGGMTHPDDALERIVDLANKIWFEKEYNEYKKMKSRDSKISNILK